MQVLRGGSRLCDRLPLGLGHAELRDLLWRADDFTVDRQHWTSRVELASAIFEWIEGWYNPRRRHTSLGMLAPHEFESLHTAAVTAA